MNKLGPGLLAAVLIAAQLGGCARVGAEKPKRDVTLSRHYVAEGVKLLNDEKVDDAQIMFTKAIDADSYSGVAYNNMGITCYRQKNYYQAAWYFQNAARLLPYQPQPRNNLGLVFEAAHKYDDAIAEYRQALNLEPNNPQLIGNLVRASLCRGDRDPEVQQLLQHLVMIEIRPDWREWAERQLNLIKKDNGNERPKEAATEN